VNREAITVEKLGRKFKQKKEQDLWALKEVNLTINEGELFGLLGPNGAGKTTLIKILTTLLLPTEGTAVIGGFDVVKEAHKIRPFINCVSGGDTAGYGILTTEENIWLFSQFYGIPSKVARKRIDYLLKVVGLEDKRKTKINRLSTGQSQKMNFIRGFVTDPRIMFLDEPTLGLDVSVAMDVRNFIKDWLKENNQRTVLLTTHYMMEAEQLCDRVAIIDKGHIVACDSPRKLKQRLKERTTVRMKLTPPVKDLSPIRNLAGVSGVSSRDDSAANESDITCIVRDDRVVPDLVLATSQNGYKVLSFHIQEPSLEDVFIQLVGRGLDEENQPAE
jgi:ABC-2 type transport system ATP-binding protein